MSGSSAAVFRDSTGASIESYTRYRSRRNAMGNVMQGVRPNQLRRLGSGLNHVREHDRQYDVDDADDEHIAEVVEDVPSPAVTNTANTTVEAVVPTDATNVDEEEASSAENHYGLAAVLGFPAILDLTHSAYPEDGVGVMYHHGDDTAAEYSSEEAERILRSPTHKRRRNAMPDAFEGLDEETIDRIRLLHYRAGSHESHERF